MPLSASNVAPIVLRDIRLSEGETALPPVALPGGASLRVEAPRTGSTVPSHVFVLVEHEGEPRYERSAVGGVSQVVVVRGLGKGRFRVRIECREGERHRTATQEIELDGATETVLLPRLE